MMDLLRDTLGYYDYCVPEECIASKEFEKMAKTFLEYGYRTIAINQVVDDGNLDNKKKKKKGEQRDDIVPPPIEINKTYSDGLHNLVILKRLTIVFGNQDVIHKINNSPNYRKYDIIAVQPTTQAAYQYTCNNIFADILSVNAEGKVGYKMNRKLYTQLITKGFHHEILYSPAIRDSTHRKNIINLAHLYHTFGKSRQIIVSSGATKNLEIRSPHDIMNLGLIFGLNHEQCRDAVLKNGRSVHLFSVGRRAKKAVMFATNINENNQTDTEKIENECMDIDEEPVTKKLKQ